MKKTCYVTTPIYYASGNVHIGNSYTTIVCDAFARFYRNMGFDTFYLTGMDEHGLKIEEAAKKQGITPQELTDITAKNTKELWRDLNISNDYFIRTTDDNHVKTVQKAFEKMLEKGDIYLGTYEGDYCVSCEAFFTKTQLGENNTCPDCGKPTRRVKEESYFLKLSKYEKQLLDFIDAHPDFIEPVSRRNEVISFVKSGLEDLCVSRTTFKWGIPVLSNPKHVVYVWIDALLNYLSALNYSEENDKNYQKYWLNGDKVVHVVGKDILRFHAVYWPIMLFSLGVPVNFKLYVHGWFLMKEGKMSKSKGNMVYPREVSIPYGLDSLRYYLLREMPLGNDALFSYDRFFDRYNADLANDLGNLVSRTISMINKYFGGEVSKPKALTFNFSKEVQEVIDNGINSAKDNFGNFRFQNGLIDVWNIIGRCNKYIDETCPWVLAKDENKKQELNEVMYVLYEGLRNVALLINPAMPDTSVKIAEALNIAKDDFSYENLGFGKTEKAKVALSIEPLFKRIDVKAELEKIEASKPQPKKLELKEEISIEDFEKLDLRVGKVLECKKLEGSDKLLVLQVKIEEEVRQIVSGIAKSYSPNDMVGKYVVVVANLKPAKLRGVMSYGMILAASGSKEEALEVVEIHQENEFSKVK